MTEAELEALTMRHLPKEFLRALVQLVFLLTCRLGTIAPASSLRPKPRIFARSTGEPSSKGFNFVVLQSVTKASQLK